MICQRANFFLVQSPFSLLVASGLAVERHLTEPNFLFFYVRSEDSVSLLETLQGADEFPFQHVVLLERRLAGRSLFGKLMVMKRNIYRVCSKMRGTLPGNIYAANDMFPSCQYALHRAARLASDARRIYIDEGTMSYLATYQYRKPSKLNQYLRRLTLGNWWEDLNRNGESRHIDLSLLMYPDLACDAIRRPISRLEPEICRSPTIRALIRDCLDRLRIRLDETTQHVLVLPSHSASIGHRVSDYAHFLQELCWTALKSGAGVTVKYHPAEPTTDYLNLGSTKGVRIVPSEIAAEFLFAAFPKNIRAVIADASTAVLSARWLLEEVPVIAARQFASVLDDDFGKLAASLEVHLIDSPKEVRELLTGMEPTPSA